MRLVKPWLGGFFACLSIMAHANPPSVQADRWELDKQKSNIRIYTQSIEDSQVKAFKGVTLINAPLDQVMTVMEDTSILSEWMPDVISAKLLAHDGNTKVQYVQTDIPWPGKNRDGAYQLTLKQTSSEVVIQIWAVPDYLPKNPDFVRIPYASGFWQLVALENQTEVTYQLHADPGGKLPAWLINQFATDTPYKALINLTKQVEQRED